MNLKIHNLLINSSILSLPGILSIFLSLLSIPVHLSIAGTENYGNYIIFHFPQDYMLQCGAHNVENDYNQRKLGF